MGGARISNIGSKDSVNSIRNELYMFNVIFTILLDMRNTGQASNNQPLPHITLTPNEYMSAMLFSCSYFFP